MDYKTSTINNRRYLGNKYKLLPFITKIVDEQCHSVDSVCDIFAGTGAVSSAFADKILITNDIMYSNYLSHYAWFSPEEYDNEKIISLVQQFNSMDGDYNNYMVQNFANTYFSEDDCAKIGAIRDKIEDLHVNNKVNDRERAILVTSLLYAMDKIAKTCGHYDAYRKGVEFNEHLELRVLLASHNNNARYSSSSNMFTNVDIETISPSLKFDAPAIIKAFNTEYGTSYTSLADIKVYIEKQRYDNFDNLVDTVFTDSQLISMIEWFKNRGNDDKKLIKVISDAGGDCEDIPTIFEYVVGVIWYKVSHKQGKVLSYMKLSLDTNQLPRTHAGGFEPDIVYKYPDNLPYYEAHTLLLECTLMESSTQRRGEMEPVTRHLAQYIIEEDPNAYCTFVTPELVLPVISDFRGRKDVYYFPYNKDETKYVESMNIIPIDAIDLTHIVAKNIPYEQIYKLFMDAYNDKEKNPIKWRKNSVALPLEKY